MEWLENSPPSARLALSVGGALVAALVKFLPSTFQLSALALGIALCCYGIAASMGSLLNNRDPDWLEAERKKDFERQQDLLMNKFKRVK